MLNINDEPDLGFEDDDGPWAAPDDMQYDRTEAEIEASHKKFGSRPFRELLEGLVIEKLQDPQIRLVPPLVGGSYNVLYGLAGDGSLPRYHLRLPNASSAFADEKTAGEAVVAKFLKGRTSLPTAGVLHCDLSNDSPASGPFIIMEHIDHFWSLSSRLNKRYDELEARHVFDTTIPRETVKALDVQMARHLLQILSHRFPRIGTMASPDENTYVVQTRPLAMQMQQMVELSNIPKSALPPKDQTYATADEWYTECSRMQTAPLLFQQNDFAISPCDCRNKYVARVIFHRLAKEGKLSKFGFEEDSWSAQSKDFRARQRALCPAPSGSGDFALWCDDLRPGNVLLSEEDEVVGIIDWEFTYVAPTQFSLDPPWWLCLDSPHNYDDGGLKGFTEIYEDRLGIWLEAVEEVEKELEPGSLRLPRGFPLSRYMRESWETGRFWLSYATRKTWAFDEIYWKFLDQRFFGKRPDGTSEAQLWETRLDLLTDRERDLMEPFVERRLEETKERKLVDHWDPKEVQRRFNSILGESEA